jgi:hypothetical protein
MYSKVLIIAICNNYESDVGMNCNVRLLKFKTKIVNICL